MHICSRGIWGILFEFLHKPRFQTNRQTSKKQPKAILYQVVQINKPPSRSSGKRLCTNPHQVGDHRFHTTPLLHNHPECNCINIKNANYYFVYTLQSSLKILYTNANYYLACTLTTSGMGGGGGSRARETSLANCNLWEESLFHILSVFRHASVSSTYPCQI